MKQINLILAIMSLLLVSCTSNPHYDASKAHHTESGFRNIYHEPEQRGFFAFLKWRWERRSKNILGPDEYTFSIDDSAHQYVRQNVSMPTLTWIGHATFLIQLNGLNILTDPHFSERASPLSWAGPLRVVPPAMEINDLPDIDVVIISHDHYDSLDIDSIIALSNHNKQREINFIVPLGTKSWFDSLDIDSKVIELDWGEGHNIQDTRFIAEPSQHWGKRSLFDAYKRLWASWVIQSDDYRVFFAGDTGYSRHFSDIGDKYGAFNLALLPIGAYEPRWFMKPYHVNPDETVQIHLDIKSRYSVAMHWGTFILTDEPLDEPPVKLQEALKKYAVNDAAFEVYKHGETKFLDK